MAVIEPREGDCVKTWVCFGFFSLSKGLIKYIKEVLFPNSQI